MKAHDYLEQVGKLNARIELKLKQVKALRSSLEIGSVPTDNDRVSHTPNVDGMGSRIAAVVDTEREVDELIDQLVDTKREIMHRLDQIDADGALFITERYLMLMTLDQMVEAHNLTERNVYRHISKGMKQLQAVLDAGSE